MHAASLVFSLGFMFEKADNNGRILPPDCDGLMTVPGLANAGTAKKFAAIVSNPCG